ncbi:hypothetical protein BBD42_31135 [Paenibacillus sp. BIHB 4019]|uniref:Uncharacterized protein n=1 Tax=Paenibacillus sp. BIHB 4019 TaxID=1870819 RepID=A0A1B2DRX1_9BACL|nr:Ger(x)C family spore germination protein [Paenibacillus sp. BIHB 4019]ANY65044.1 hypothetical protein BBD42_00055 [Paenibacillus sp. BIHB 4019]ANY70458.1 hypothetical protein BBD42_31135 [Paenibacillus sp. BIHB 4019]
MKMRWLKLMLLALCMLLACTALSGCGFKDIDKRYFIVAMGIDYSGKKQNPFLITLRLAIASPKIEPGAGKAQVETIEAASIAEGVRMLKAHVDKELDFGHCKIFLIGERVAYKDYSPVLDWMKRRRDIQSIANLAIGKPDARTILKINPQAERYPGNALFLSFGADGTDNPYTYVENLSDLTRRVMEKGLDPVLPIIRNEGTSGYIINHTALLDKSKIKLVLKPEESQLFNQLAQNYEKSSIQGSFSNNRIVGAISKIKSHYHFSEHNGKLQLNMDVRIKALMEEAPPHLFEQGWGQVEQKLSQDYSKLTDKLLIKIQQAGVDPFGFGLHYRATHGGEAAWKQWENIYPTLQFAVNARIKIEGTGLIK